VPKGILGYAIAGVPAAIGVWFIANYAYTTSDDGWSAAFQLGFMSVVAYAGPAVALMVATTGRKVAGVLLGILAAGAMFANWSQTLDALANRGAGREAEMAKISANVRSDRARLERIERERAAIPNVSATDEAVKAAQAAVTAAEGIRAAECERRGPNCRARETEEQTKRDALAKVLADKAMADKAAKLDREASEINTRLANTPAVKETSAGKTLGALLSLSAVSAATFQQQFFSAIVELAIAASLALPELLRPRHAPATRHEEEKLEPQHAGELVTIMPQEPTKLLSPEASLVARFMLQCLPRDPVARVMRGAAYKRFLRWCDDQKVDALNAPTFWQHFEPLCRRVGLRIVTRGGKVYCVGVKLAA
jgi:hypothetical protein